MLSLFSNKQFLNFLLNFAIIKKVHSKVQRVPSKFGAQQWTLTVIKCPLQVYVLSMSC